MSSRTEPPFTHRTYIRTLARFFVEALLGLAEQLGDVAPTKRAEKLQEGLERINEFFLSERAQGSDVIYVPFRGGFHQVCMYHTYVAPD